MKKEILLAHFPKITIKRYRELTEAFSNLDAAWQAEFSDFKKINWQDNFINEFLLWRDNVNPEKINLILEKEHIQCITIEDETYPPLLKKVFDPPFCLFARGNLSDLKYPLAVVGSRKHSSYGKQITENLIPQLVRNNIEIISGLALGIDGIAHCAALQTGGRTIAVLGGGINKQHIYPATHKQLSEKIIENNGAIISEYPPGALPNTYTFPRRNRIIAGISIGTLIIEAGETSGALITAQYAIDNNREVFVVPQNITSPTAVGSNSFLKNGAYPITNVQDILCVFDIQEINKEITSKKSSNLSSTEALIIQFLSREPIHIDELIKKTALPSQDINSALIIMEMKNNVRNIGSMMYVLTN